ncbi:MAG TPA: hypothetical protein VFU96_06410, partial [Acidimicrobiia bacterium]|nr:hypothetical protein [Acidimicrobiia bacterium]
MAADVLMAAPNQGLGRGSKLLIDRTHQSLADLGDDRSTAAAQRAVVEALRSPPGATDDS